jgi:hypothetical protein
MFGLFWLTIWEATRTLIFPRHSVPFGAHPRQQFVGACVCALPWLLIHTHGHDMQLPLVEQRLDEQARGHDRHNLHYGDVTEKGGGTYKRAAFYAVIQCAGCNCILN